MREIPLFSIIICLYKVNERFFKDLEKYSYLSLKDFEIILATEKNANIEERIEGLSISSKVRIIKAPKDKISLGEKRDLGAESAKGEFLAYIDDDAYPDKEWLGNALKNFKEDKNLGAVGGPNVTPPEDGYWEKIGGYIYESYLTSAGAQYRFLPKKKRFVAELQGVNLLIRADALKQVGGFNSKLNSGDDSKVCSSLRQAGYKVLYDPRVLVFHHRRAFPFGHLKQIKNMGTHRGFFVKAFPDTLAPIYFLPVIFLIGILALIVISIFSQSFRMLLEFLVLLSFGACYFLTVRRSGFISSLFVALGIILTQLTYGIFFIKGLLIKKL